MLLVALFWVGTEAQRQPSGERSVMDQLEMSVSDQKIQGLRDRLQGEDDSLLREIANRRRPGRAAEVSPDLVPLLRGEAPPVPPAGGEVEAPHGLEHTTPMFGIADYLTIALPLLGTLGLVAWTILR